MSPDGKKELHGLNDVISEVARLKKQAARARGAGADPDAERPKEVFAEACRRVSAAFEPLGFAFTVTSGLKRNRGDWTHWIPFGTSYNNVAGVHVQMTVSVQANPKQLRDWRKAQPYLLRSAVVDYFAGGHLGNLLPKKRWIQWNLADPSERPKVIESVVASIQTIAIPWLSQFEDQASLLDRLESRLVTEAQVGETIEYFLACNERDRAIRCGRGFLREHPEIEAEYEQALQTFSRKSPELGRGVSGWAEQLAFFKVLYALDI